MQLIVSDEFTCSYGNQVHTEHEILFSISLEKNKNKTENRYSSFQSRYLFTCLLQISNTSLLFQYF